MKVLFDQGTPAPLRRALVDHDVETAYERGWAGLTNGELIAAAEQEGFAALVTTDQSLRYQQNLAVRRLSVVVLLTTSWPRIRRGVARVAAGLAAASPGSYIEVDFEDHP